MRNPTKLLALAAAMACALGAAPLASAADAQPAVANAAAPARLDDAVIRGDVGARLQQAQFLWAGRNYCWYAGGWHGPGYYWCGYAWRRGFGWGGPIGWHGWHGRGWHGGWRHGGGWHHGGWRHH